MRRFGIVRPLRWGILLVSVLHLSAQTLKWSHEGGIVNDPVELRVTASSPNARIFFSTDGQLPSPQSSQRLEETFVFSDTKIIRAAAFEGDRAVSEVETRSFIIPNKNPNAKVSAFPSTWGLNGGKPVPAYYDFAFGESNRAEIVQALKALPIVSIVLEPNDLFGTERGIYSNPLKTGGEWERRCSLEYFSKDGGSARRVDCGIRIQGGWNRRPEESPKHAFRVVFKKKYGPGKWRAPLFDRAEPQAFDELILRAGCNNTWLHWSGEERRRGEYLRDQFMRDSYREMGHPSARGEFVHLYLNGLYWGIYNLTERPGAEFAAVHFGGKASEYDARNADNILSGDTEAWERLMSVANAGVTNSARYETISGMLDMTAFADFMILNLYGGNADWDRASNWYAARRRAPGGKFHFFMWDGERTLEDAGANTMASDDDQSPTRLFQRLRVNQEFRELFNKRARLHLMGGGALSPEKTAVRYRRLAEGLREAIVCEALRWGAYRHDAHQYKTGPYEIYTREKHWTPEVDRLLRNFFPQRSGIVFEQFRSVGLASDQARRD